MKLADLWDARVIVWSNHGTEGWRPHAYASYAEVVEALACGEFHGAEVVITKPLGVRVEEKT